VRWILTRLTIVAVGVMIVLTSLACFDEGEVLTVPSSAGEEAAQKGRKCDEALGKAFASADERQWFLDNCSSWTTANIPQSPPQAPVRQEPAECAQMRGRPYTSEQQRAWFLQNCLGNSASASALQVQGGDRQDCNQIRGTPYRSEAERAWYYSNCLVSSGPDRTDCNQIRGTQYRSDTERQWYLSNCLSVSPAVQSGNNGNGNSNGNRSRGRGGGGDDDD
jgi:hypothetical protein